MANLNLLPWRENRIVFKNRKFLSISAVVALIGGVLVLLSGIYVNGLTASEEEDIKKIRLETNKLENLISEIKGLQEQKKLLLARREVIETLQASRPFIVKVFDGIAKSVPNGVYLRELTRVGNQLTIEGISESNSRVSSFMRELQKMDWVSEAARLGEIKTQDTMVRNSDGSEVQEIEFKLNLTLRY